MKWIGARKGWMLLLAIGIVAVAAGPRSDSERIAELEVRVAKLEQAIVQLAAAAPPRETANPPASKVDSDRPAAGAAPKGVEPDRAARVIVYTTKSGSKYHRAGCSYLRSSSISIELGAAKARGMSPCSRCGPSD
jgi:hypothetical protein